MTFFSGMAKHKSTHSNKPTPLGAMMLLFKIQLGHCKMCTNDAKVFCPRDCDVICIECGLAFCAGHIIKHMETEHFITPNMDHCSSI